MEEKISKGMGKAHLMEIHRAQFPENTIRSISKEYYEWKVYKNPAMVGDIYLEMRDGRSVGSSTVMPKKIAILDEIVLAAEWADNFTVPEYRKQGINLKAVNVTKDYVISHDIDLIYGVPNEVNYPTYIKLGCKPCVYIGWTSLTKSLNPLRFASKLIAKIIVGREVHKNFRHLSHLSKRLTTRRRSLQPFQNSSKNDFNIMPIDRFSNDVDPLWGKPRYLFFVYRDKQYLNWRYFDNPDKFIVLAAFKGQNCLGYISLKISNDKRTGIMCDFVTVDDRSDVFLSLVGESEKILRRNGVESIQLKCVVNSPYYHDLNILGYYDLGRESNSPVVIYAKTETGKRILENPGTWHFTFGDTDEV